MPLLRRTSTFRGVFFVGANLLGFMAACAFLYYLTTGRWYDFSLSGMRRALAVPLSEILVRPPSIYSHPWMIVVTGLVLGVVAFVPLMVAVLYRLWVSAVFVLVLAAFAHAPMLAACLALGCIVAGHTRLRSDLPFLALLLGLSSALGVYLIVYFLFISPEPRRVLSAFQRLVFQLPFVVAFVSVVLAAAVVLALARLTRYRPGVIWPALLVLVAAPVWLFHAMVGRSELAYAALVEGVVASEKLLPAGRFELPPAGAAAPTSAASRPGLPAPAAQALARMELRRAELRARCERFLRRYPDSPRGAAVMWVLATLEDLEPDMQALRRGLTRWTYTGPSEPSAGAWYDLVDRFPDSPQALVAQYRLGIVALRQERIKEGWEHLHTAMTQLEDFTAPVTPSLWERVFVPMESLPGMEYYRQALERIRQVVWLMEANRVLTGSAEDVRALAEYMRLWPDFAVPARRLEALAAGAGKTRLADNFRFRAAMAVRDELARAEALAAVAAEANDGAVAANYELGRLALRLGDKPAWRRRKLKSAVEYFKLVASAPDSPYRPRAERLRRLAGGVSGRCRTRQTPWAGIAHNSLNE